MKVEVLYLSPAWAPIDLKVRCPHCELVLWAESLGALQNSFHRVQVIFGGKGPHTTLSAERERLRRERSKATA